MTCIVVTEKMIAAMKASDTMEGVDMHEIFDTEQPFDDTMLSLCVNGAHNTLLTWQKYEKHWIAEVQDAVHYYKFIIIKVFDDSLDKPGLRCEVLETDCVDKHYLDMAAFSVQGFISVLYYINNINTEYEAPERAYRRGLNKKHQNIAKDDIYTLCIGGKKTKGKATGLGNKKRFHLRRGHYHTYNTNEGPIRRWLKPQWVGNKELGTIRKDYTA
jgi:hypothetical protein